jgi:hypothetical protein
VAAYVNAKYHVKKDLTQIMNLKLAERRVIKAGQLYNTCAFGLPNRRSADGQSLLVGLLRGPGETTAPNRTGRLVTDRLLHMARGVRHVEPVLRVHAVARGREAVARGILPDELAADAVRVARLLGHRLRAGHDQLQSGRRGADPLRQAVCEQDSPRRLRPGVHRAHRECEEHARGGARHKDCHPRRCHRGEDQQSRTEAAIR